MNRTRGRCLARQAGVADTRWTRLRGLLGRPALRPGQGLVIVPSRGVHTYGMRYPIDVVFLGEDGEVAATYPTLPPWTRTSFHQGVDRVVELPAGTIEDTGTRAGDRLELVDPDRADRSAIPGEQGDSG